MDRLLRTADPARTMVMVEADSTEEEERVWSEWWDALEVFRLYAEEPQAWTSMFHVGLKSALHPRERMALPGGVEEDRGRRH